MVAGKIGLRLGKMGGGGRRGGWVLPQILQNGGGGGHNKMELVVKKIEKRKTIRHQRVGKFRVLV